jgi:hypothetical protein
MKRYYLRISGQEPIDVSSLGTFCVGREGDIVIRDRYMSRRHFTIKLPKHDEDETLLTDGDGANESKFGTTVAGKFLHFLEPEEEDRSVFLRHNDEIVAGKTKITYLEFDAQSDTDANLNDSKRTL